MVESKYLHHKQNVLHYVKAGNGNDTLLFFHGFGQDHSIYLPLVQSLATDFRLFIFDLYFHGKSTWAQGERPLEKTEWKETVEIFLHENNIMKFSMVGFSLGGKFAMATLEAFPDQVHQLFLIAPDGIKTSFWYSLATYPLLFRSFFKSMILYPNRFQAIANFLHKRNLVDKGLIRFADFQMNSEEKRRRVYFSWIVFRHLTFNLKKLAELINTNDIKTTVIAGEYDKVIVPKNMNRFLKHLKKSDFKILPSGHSGLIYASLPYIQKEKK